MAWKFNFSTTRKYPTIVPKFLMDYPQGGEGWCRVKRVVRGIGVAHGRGRRRSARGQRRASGPEAAVCFGRSGRGRGRALGPEAMTCSERRGRGRRHALGLEAAACSG
jgi:hypothetical protein